MARMTAREAMVWEFYRTFEAMTNELPSNDAGDYVAAIIGGAFAEAIRRMVAARILPERLIEAIGEDAAMKEATFVA